MMLIWSNWAVSLAMIAWLTICVSRRMSWAPLRRLALSEDGAAYTLSYVMVVPIYILFMCLVVETTLMLLTKFGSNYAAYAGARSAVVHYSDNLDEVAGEWAQHAAIQSFVPFSNGTVEPGNMNSDEQINRYLKAYYDYTGGSEQANKPTSAKYLRSKYEYAKKHLRTTTSFKSYPPAKQDEPWLKDCTVTVIYDYAFHVPLVGRLLGGTWDANSKALIYTVESTATLDSEGPKNKDGRLGIEYEQWRNERPWD